MTLIHTIRASGLPALGLFTWEGTVTRSRLRDTSLLPRIGGVPWTVGSAVDKRRATPAECTNIPAGVRCGVLGWAKGVVVFYVQQRTFVWYRGLQMGAYEAATLASAYELHA